MYSPDMFIADILDVEAQNRSVEAELRAVETENLQRELTTKSYRNCSNFVMPSNGIFLKIFDEDKNGKLIGNSSILGSEEMLATLEILFNCKYNNKNEKTEEEKKNIEIERIFQELLTDLRVLPDNYSYVFTWKNAKIAVFHNKYGFYDFNIVIHKNNTLARCTVNHLNTVDNIPCYLNEMKFICDDYMKYTSVINPVKIVPGNNQIFFNEKFLFNKSILNTFEECITIAKYWAAFFHYYEEEI